MTQREKELTEALAYLYGWVSTLPVKHPQQAEMREKARKLLDDGKEQSR